MGYHAPSHWMETDKNRHPTIDRQHDLDNIVYSILEMTMDELMYELLTEVSGRAEADILKAFLIGNGLEDVELFQESLGVHAYPSSLDMLGIVQMFVPKEQLDSARKLLEEYNNATE
jgi:hypothetical protein